MDDLRKHLDDEARRVNAPEDALDGVRRRKGRRRVTRQIGTGTLALAVAAGGFALAWNAFQGGPAGRPLVGPSASLSPTGPRWEGIRAKKVYRFVADFMAARRKGSGAEAFVSPAGHRDFMCCDLALYPDADLDHAPIVKFDKVNPAVWVVQIRTEYPLFPAPCHPRIERLTIGLVSEGTAASTRLLITSAQGLDVICRVGGEFVPQVSSGAPRPVEQLQQGGRYWAVYITLDDRASFVRPVADRMEEQGFAVSSGKIACDQGAAENLEVPNDVFAVAAYFNTQEDALSFFAAVEPGPIGIVSVQTYCED